MKIKHEGEHKPINKKLLIGIAGGAVLLIAIIVGLVLLLSGGEDMQLKLSPSEQTLAIGETVQLQLTDSDKPVKANWTSSNAAIATVDENGCVTAVAAGTARVTAVVSEGGMAYAASAEITVTGKKPDQVSVPGDLPPELPPQALYGPLAAHAGNVAYDPGNHMYTMGEGEAAAMTENAYQEVELTATFCPDTWPIQGFVVKQGDNLVAFKFGSEGYDTAAIRVYVNNLINGSEVTTIATDFRFSLYGAYSYDLKLTYDGVNIMMLLKEGNIWRKINKEPISLAAILGDSFDPSQGISVGIAGFESCGRMFKDISIAEQVTTLPSDPDDDPNRDNGPLPIFTGNVEYDSLLGMYYMGDGDATAMTEKLYQKAELDVNFCPNVWPIQGFALKQGSNLVTFKFGSEGYDAQHIRIEVNGKELTKSYATAFSFSLVGAYSYDLKMTFDGKDIHFFLKEGENWKRINAEPISLASILGSNFDASQGVSVGIAGFDGCGRMFRRITVAEEVTTQPGEVITPPVVNPNTDKGPLSNFTGNVTYNPNTGMYVMGEGDAFALTEKTYKEAELTATFCPDVWPVQGFAVKQGNNTVVLRFGSEGYDAHRIMVYVNDFKNEVASIDTAFDFSLVGAYSYDMKMTFDGANINLFVKENGSWKQINKEAISLAEIPGSNFDSSEGIAVGIAGLGGCGRQFKGATIADNVTTLPTNPTNPPVDDPNKDNGPLSVLTGNVTYNPGTGMYVMGEGDAFALTEKTYKEAELTATFCPNVWPVQGFAVKQGNNTVVLRFGSEGYDAHRIMVYVNDFKNEIASIDTAFDFSLVGAYSYDMKMTFDGANINLFVKENGSWKQINKEAISLAEIPGSNFDSSEGIAVGIAGLGGCGRQFKNVMVTAQ